MQRTGESLFPAMKHPAHGNFENATLACSSPSVHQLLEAYDSQPSEIRIKKTFSRQFLYEAKSAHHRHVRRFSQLRGPLILTARRRKVLFRNPGSEENFEHPLV